MKFAKNQLSKLNITNLIKSQELSFLLKNQICQVSKSVIAITLLNPTNYIHSRLLNPIELEIEISRKLTAFMDHNRLLNPTEIKFRISRRLKAFMELQDTLLRTFHLMNLFNFCNNLRSIIKRKLLLVLLKKLVTNVCHEIKLSK